MASGALSPDAAASLPVHPTQLYAALSGVVLYLALGAMPRVGDGRRFVVLVIGYGVARSVIELFRGDASRGHIGALSTSQMLAVLTVLVTLAAWRHARVRSA